MHPFAGALLSVQRGLIGVVTPEILAVNMVGGPNGFGVTVYHTQQIGDNTMAEVERQLSEAIANPVWEGEAQLPFHGTKFCVLAPDEKVSPDGYPAFARAGLKYRLPGTVGP